MVILTRDPRYVSQRCTKIAKGTGNQCQRPGVPGTVPPVCKHHGGFAPQTLRKARVRAELMQWGLNGEMELADPGETLLRLVTQSRYRADFYAELVRKAYEAAEALAALPEGLDLLKDPDPDNPETAAAQVARANWIQIFATGGVGALIGNRYSSGDFGVYATGEAIRGLVELEIRERELCANFSSKAVAAGLGERLVRMYEQQGAMLATVLRAALGNPALGLTEHQRAATPMIIEQAIGELLEGNGS